MQMPQAAWLRRVRCGGGGWGRGTGEKEGKGGGGSMGLADLEEGLGCQLEVAIRFCLQPESAKVMLKAEGTNHICNTAAISGSTMCRSLSKCIDQGTHFSPSHKHHRCSVVVPHDIASQLRLVDLSTAWGVRLV